MMRIGFGKRFQDENERKKVLGLLNELQETIVDNYVSDIWPGLPFVNLVDRFMGKTDRLEKCFQEFDLFYQQLIDEHLDGRNIKSYEDEDDVIDILLRFMKDKLFGLTHKHIKALLMVIHICFIYWLNMNISLHVISIFEASSKY
ncbi:putative cytochrome P450 superfamily [Helianthus debilis subsp. tardiflorus]